MKKKTTKPKGNNITLTKRQTLDSLHVDHMAQAILNAHKFSFKKTCKLDTEQLSANWIQEAANKQPAPVYFSIAQVDTYIQYTTA